MKYSYSLSPILWCVIVLFLSVQNIAAQKINYYERQWETLEKNKIYVSYANSYQHYNKNKVPALPLTTSWKTRAWKGERINTMILLWSAADVGKIRVQASDLVDAKGNKIDSPKLKVSFMDYVWTDGYFGNGCNARDGKMLDSALVADVIDTLTFAPLEARSVQPLWVSIDVPRDIEASTYSGRITVEAGKSIMLNVAIHVADRILPPAEQWKFDLDLWQYPVSIAAYHKVPLWSDDHFRLMKPYFEMLARAGQKNISISMIEGGNQGKEVSPAMIRFIKKKDGTWQYDYSLFDKYVSFMMDCGIKKRINCYSMVPWKLNFGYYDEALSKDTVLTTSPLTQQYKDYWMPMLKKFAAHLKEKNWFEKTCMAMDERKLEDMQAVIQIAKEADPDWKIALAGSYHEELMQEIDDYSIFRSYTFTPEQLQYRNQHFMSSTFYTSCEGEKPNMFTFSEPAESVWMGWYAAAKGFTGYLRWAYNLWNKNPLHDSRGIYPAGDFSQIYPGPRSSVRFEKLIEGIQDYEKIKIICESSSRERVRPLLNVINHFEVEALDSRSADEIIKKAKFILNNY